MATNNSWNSQDPVQVALGGTGLSAITANTVMTGNGTGPVNLVAAGTNGQALLGSTGAEPIFATLSSSDGSVTFTPGAGTLSLQVAVPVSPWVDVTGASQAMAVNTSYTADRATLVTLTLPAVAAYGSTFRIVGKGVGGWLLAQGAGQTVHFGVANTTTGATGSLASSAQYDTITFVCSIANTDFTVYDSIGNITYA
jgi:hypothetical protein